MNTDDEKREEYNRKVAERRSVELSQSNLPSLSVNGGINGHILCTFNQENLEVLKKENSLNLYQQMRNSMRSLLRKQFPGFNWKDDSNSAENGNFLNKDRVTVLRCIPRPKTEILKWKFYQQK